jgi:hypothetical protein
MTTKTNGLGYEYLLGVVVGVAILLNVGGCYNVKPNTDDSDVNYDFGSSHHVVYYLERMDGRDMRYTQFLDQIMTLVHNLNDPSSGFMYQKLDGPLRLFPFSSWKRFRDELSFCVVGFRFPEDLDGIREAAAIARRKKARLIVVLWSFNLEYLSKKERQSLQKTFDELSDQPIDIIDFRGHLVEHDLKLNGFLMSVEQES